MQPGASSQTGDDMAKRDRVWHPKPHRAVEFNEKAIQKVIDQHGHILASPKIDGIRCLVQRQPDPALRESRPVLITTREGIEIECLQPLLWRVKSELERKFVTDSDIVLDAELYIKGLPFDESSGILRRRSELPAEYWYLVRIAVFDITFRQHVEGEACDPDPLSARARRRLRNSGATDIIRYVNHAECSALSEITEVFNHYRELGMEGLVIKDPRLPYRNGKVSGWWKMKPEITEDGVVVGYVWGEEGKANAGKVVGFEVRLESGEIVRATGLTQDQMEVYTNTYLTEKYGSCDTYTPLIGRYCEVKAMERTASGKLRHPHFKCWRDMEGAEGVKA
jgi:ATP-dependent DNA ligase